LNADNGHENRQQETTRPVHGENTSPVGRITFVYVFCEINFCVKYNDKDCGMRVNIIKKDIKGVQKIVHKDEKVELYLFENKHLSMYPVCFCDQGRF
jgi:hypothetical protein